MNDIAATAGDETPEETVKLEHALGENEKSAAAEPSTPAS
jgi:hypothetical protein